MSQSEAQQVITRTMSDEDFLDDFKEDPENALNEYDLTDREKVILKSQDEYEIRKLVGDTSGEHKALMFWFIDAGATRK